MSPILWLLLTVGAVLGDLLPNPTQPRPIEVVDANSDSSSLLFIFRIHVDSPINRGGLINVVFPPELALKTAAPTCTVNQVGESKSACTFASQLLSVPVDNFISRNSTLRLRAHFPESLTITGGTQHFSIYTQNFTSGQPQDINFSFGQVAFLPAPVAMDSKLATLQVDSKLVNATTDYTLQFVTAAEIYSGSEFRLTLPSASWPGLASAGPCTVTGVTYPVLGNFACYKDRYSLLPAVRIAGLVNDIPAGTTLILKFKSITNPICQVTSQGSALLDVVGGGTYGVRQRLSLSMFTPATGTLKGVSQKPYHSYAAFYQDNKVLDLLEFTTITGIPSGGKITIDFKAPNALLSGNYLDCNLMSDSFFVNGASPSCDLVKATGKATITALPASPAGTTFQVLVRLQLGTANFAAPVIQTLTGSCVIDENSSQLGGVVPSFAADSVKTRDYAIITGKSGMTLSFKLKAGFTIGQVQFTLSPNWRPYAAEKVFCSYSITTNLIMSTTTSFNIPQELCAYGLADNTLTWTPATAVALNADYTLEMTFGHRGNNPTEVFSWRPLVASSRSTHHEFVLRLYDTAQTLVYADHKYVPEALPLNTGVSVYAAPSGFPAALYAPVTVTPQPFFDSIPVDSRMKTFVELRFYRLSGLVATWTTDLGHEDASLPIPCALSAPLQSLSSALPAFCKRYPEVDGYVPVRVWNIAPLRRYTTPSLKVLVKGPANVATNVRIDVGFGYLLNDVYYNYQQMDQMTLSLGITSLAAGTLDVRKRPGTDLNCQQDTYLTIGVGTMLVNPTTQTIILHFPANWWGVSTPTLQSSTGTCATATFFLSPYKSVVECTGFALNSGQFFKVVTKNQDYANDGVGKVRLYLLGSGRYFESNEDLPSCTAPAIIPTSITSIPQQFGSPGASLHLTFSLSGAYTALDSLLITMKNGVYTNGICMTFSSFATCTEVSLKSGTFLVKVSTGTIKDVGGVEIKQVLLPSTGSLTYNLSVCKGSATTCLNKNSVSADTSLALLSPAFPGDLLIGKVELVPNNRVTDSHLHLQMVANREIPSRSVIKLEATFNWPSVGTFNYIFSHEYRSIVVSSTTLSLTVGKRIRAYELLELETFYVTLAAATAATWETITGSVTYYDYEYLKTPVLTPLLPTPHPEPNAILPFAQASSTLAITSFSLDFLNVGERVEYSFVISNTATGADTRPVEYLRIRFPDGYGLKSEKTKCKLGENAVKCWVMSDYRSVLVAYSSASLATGSIQVTISNVRNPISPAGGFTVATMFNQTLYAESKQTTTSIGFTTPPAILDLMVLNKTTSYVREPAVYTFLARSYATKTLNYGALSVATHMNVSFSDNWRLQGLTVNASGYNWTFPGTNTTEIVPFTLPALNDDTNHLALDLSASWFPFSGIPTVLTVGGLVTPHEPGSPSSITGSTYSLTSKAVWAKTYPHLSQASVTQVINEGFRLLAPQEITLIAGTSTPVAISTAGYFWPARYSLTIGGATSSAQLKLSASNITIAQGETQGQFVLSAGITLGAGTYFVYWKVSGDDDVLRYERLPTLKVNVVQGLVAVNAQPIPQLQANSTSFPFTLSLDHSPEANLTVTLTPSENVTVSPATLDFAPGETTKTYTVSTAAESAGFWGSVDFVLSGTDAAVYWLPVNVLSFSIRTLSNSEPTFKSAKMTRPKQTHSMTMEVKSDIPAYLYTLYQESGLAPPTVADLLASPLVDITSPADCSVSRTYSGLSPNTRYDWYGVLVAENKMESDIKKVTFSTARRENAVDFTIEIQGPNPSNLYLLTTFQPWVGSVLSIPECWLQMLDVARDTPVEGQHRVSLRLCSQDNEERMSPLEMVRALGSSDYLTNALADYTVTSFAADLREYTVDLPNWEVYPRLFNGNSSMVQAVLTPGVDGVVYAAAYVKGMRPSASDVKWGRTSRRDPAEYSAWQEVKAGQTTVLSLAGLQPSPNHVVYFVLQNQRTDEEEMTIPFPLAIHDFAYSYLNDVSEVDMASALVAVSAVLGLSLL